MSTDQDSGPVPREAVDSEPARSVEAKAQECVRGLAEGFQHLRESYAVLRYLASADFARWAAEIKNNIIVNARVLYPGETYEQTAERLGTSVASVNRAVSAWNKRNAPTQGD